MSKKTPKLRPSPTAANKSKTKRPRPDLEFEEFEPRLLMSADLPIDVDAVLATASEQEQVNVVFDVSNTTMDQESQAHCELVIVDTDTPDYQTLVDVLTASDETGRRFDVVVLDNSRDGIEQITDLLGSYDSLDAVHIISHGEDGILDLGGSRLDGDSLGQHADAIEGWSNSFSESGDLLIYGCNLAASAEGQSIVDRLANITGADVAASDDLTGHASLGGDWDLEYAYGDIEAAAALNTAAQDIWQHLLDIDSDLVVHHTYDTDASDSANNYDGTLGDDAAIDNSVATNQIGSGKLSLDGDNDYVDMAAHADDLKGFTEGTIAAWINFTSTADGTIFNIGDGAANNNYAWLHVNNGNLYWDFFEDGITEVSVASTASYNDGAWHHVAVTADSSGTSLYVDGTELTGGAINFIVGDASDDEFFGDLTTVFQSEIGAYDVGSGPEGEFTGLLDDFRICDRALSGTDIDELYNFSSSTNAL